MHFDTNLKQLLSDLPEERQIAIMEEISRMLNFIARKERDRRGVRLFVAEQRLLHEAEKMGFVVRFHHESPSTSCHLYRVREDGQEDYVRSGIARAHGGDQFSRKEGRVRSLRRALFPKKFKLK